MIYFLMLLLSTPALATDLVFINQTNEDVRIASLSNKCDGILVHEDAPIHIKPSQRHVFKDIVPVVHSYTVCGLGLCIATAVGINKSSKYYIRMTANNGYLETEALPEHWDSGNFTCPKK